MKKKDMLSILSSILILILDLVCEFLGFMLEPKLHEHGVSNPFLSEGWDQPKQKEDNNEKTLSLFKK